ncbi:hypothetical protein BKA62DRAFT_731138 [Auriculariales sp. MPI-PUGE-AT-0066]|nr:hypothetical protein BKA62DRAFT_731138 [Auriculariales sp. MPI-PUGE-AT-0066]
MNCDILFLLSRPLSSTQSAPTNTASENSERATQISTSTSANSPQSSFDISSQIWAPLGRAYGAAAALERNRTEQEAAKPVATLAGNLFFFPTLNPVSASPRSASAELKGTPEPRARPSEYHTEQPLTPSLLATRVGDAHARTPLDGARATTLLPSPYRPDVCAGERLRYWTSEFAAQSLTAGSSPISHSQRVALIDAVLSSVDPETRTKYGAGLVRLHEFGDLFSIAEAARMPASDQLLAAFASHHVGKVAKGTVDNWLCGIKLWHVVYGAPWHGGPMLKAVLKATAKLAPASSFRPRRPPITVRHLEALEAGLALTSPFDAAVFAAATFAFRGCCRLGEVLVPVTAKFDPARHATRSAPLNIEPGAGGCEILKVHIPWSKTTQARGADISVSSTGDAICPIAAVRNHLRANRAVPAGAPLFAFASAGGGWRVLDRTTFLARCSDIWQAHGLDDVFGHSFRIGGTTDMLARGIPPAVVALHGRWASAAFLKYVREIEKILPVFLAMAPARYSPSTLTAALAASRNSVV